MKAPSKLVVNATTRHLLQRVDEDRAQRFVSCAKVAINHEVERRGMRELGSMSESPVHPVEHLQGRFDDGVNNRSGNCSASAERLGTRDRAFDQLRLLEHVTIFF